MITVLSVAIVPWDWLIMTTTMTMFVEQPIVIAAAVQCVVKLMATKLMVACKDCHDAYAMLYTVHKGNMVHIPVDKPQCCRWLLPLRLDCVYCHSLTLYYHSRAQCSYLKALCYCLLAPNWSPLAPYFHLLVPDCYRWLQPNSGLSTLVLRLATDAEYHPVVDQPLICLQSVCDRISTSLRSFDPLSICRHYYYWCSRRCQAAKTYSYLTLAAF